VLIGMVRRASYGVLRVCNRAVHHARVGRPGFPPRGAGVWSNAELGLILLLRERQARSSSTSTTLILAVASYSYSQTGSPMTHVERRRGRRRDGGAGRRSWFRARRNRATVCRRPWPTLLGIGLIVGRLLAPVRPHLCADGHCARRPALLPVGRGCGNPEWYAGRVASALHRPSLPECNSGFRWRFTGLRCPSATRGSKGQRFSLATGFPPGACGNDEWLLDSRQEHAGMTNGYWIPARSMRE
jgi:hypothetical protein